MIDQDEVLEGASLSSYKEKIEKETKQFIKTTKDYLKKKKGNIPPEWGLALKLLETYYRQFLVASYQLEEDDNLVMASRYGVVENPLIKIQNQAAIRLEKQMAELGLSLKSQKKLDMDVVQEEDSPLQAFVKGSIERRGQ